MPHLCSRHGAIRWVSGSDESVVLLSIPKFSCNGDVCLYSNTTYQSKNSIKVFIHLPLNRSRRCRPTYQQAVSKFGNGVRVLTFSRFSISYALQRINQVVSARHCASLWKRFITAKYASHKIFEKVENLLTVFWNLELKSLKWGPRCEISQGSINNV